MLHSSVVVPISSLRILRRYSEIAVYVIIKDNTGFGSFALETL